MQISFLEGKGFVRKMCAKCKEYFWTLNKERKTCGDTTCDSYSFLGEKITNRRYDIDEMRSTFLNFFSKDHTLLQPYPVIPRWREDVLLVNASIYDFQPHVTSGFVKPPANPIVMSQPSIRMIDIDNVGVTGRHLTSFEMMCHDSFNWNGHSIYWIDGTVSRCYEFLTEALGVAPVEITFKEEPWSGGGNAGEALEVCVRGLEVATLVFMDMQIDPEGTVEIEGNKYSRMKMQIVDTGYGLERLSWLSYGTSTIYDSLYPKIIRFLEDKSGLDKIDPAMMAAITQISVANPGLMPGQVIDRIYEEDEKLRKNYSKDQLLKRARQARAVYTVADHSRSILFMLSDYVIPSNVKVGYVLRILIRRSLRSLSTLGLDNIIPELLEMQSRKFSSVLHEVPWDFAFKAISEETEKYSTSLKNGEAIISRYIKAGKKITEKEISLFYDSHGIDPETALRIVEEHGGSVNLPQNFDLTNIAIHEISAQKKKGSKNVPDLETRPLYYDDKNLFEFTGLVLYSKDKMLVTNQTAFYPEGGGQPCDLGYFEYGSRKITVNYVEKRGKTIIHHVDADVPENTRVKGHVEQHRRRRLMLHHSATHLLLAISREVLGPQVWQAGAQKGVDESRLDITHFSKLTDQEISAIERRCLEVIKSNTRITVKNLDWYKALDKFGFGLFQGGVPLGEKLRVVEIEGIDAEGCGGTHLDNTSSIGIIKILKADSVQEGIQRLIFCAGEAALDYMQKLQTTLKRIQVNLGSDLDNLPDAFEKFRSRTVAISRDLEALRKKRINEWVEKSELIQVAGRKIRVIECDPDPEEFSLLGKVAAGKKEEITILKTDGDNNHRYSIFYPGGDASSLLKTSGKKLSPSASNKFMVSFQSDLDHIRLINMLFDKRGKS